MKATVAYLLFTLVSVAIPAEPAAKFQGLAGIPFGSTPDEVKASLDARGAKLDSAQSTSAHLGFRNGRFNNEDAWYWHFDFLDGKLFRSSVVLLTKSEGVAAFDRIKKMVTDKYGKPFQETKVNMSPEELHDLVCEGKLEVEANWKAGESGGYTITCKLSRHDYFPVIRLIYRDDTESAKLRKRESNDL